MTVLHDILLALSYPSYIAPILSFLTLIHFLRARYHKLKYTLNDVRLEYGNLTSNDGSRIMLVVFLLIFISTIIVYPTMSDLLDIQDIRFKPSGTYSYAVQLHSGKSYPAKITKDGRKYYIKAMYKEDEIILFEDDPDYNEINLKDYSYCTTEDYDDSEHLLLLNHHIEDDRIHETTYLTVPFILLFIVIICSDIFLFVVYFPKDKFDHKAYTDQLIEEMDNGECHYLGGK